MDSGHTYEYVHCLGSLMHAVHLDNAINAKNALFQYCGMQMLMRLAGEGAPPDQYNDAVWQIKARIEKPAICFRQLDPISEPQRPIPLTHHCLVVPNNTSMDSSSTLVKQAADRFPVRMDDVPSNVKLGDVVTVPTVTPDYYSGITHMVCRTPGDKRPMRLAQALVQLASLQGPVVYRVPVFDDSQDARQWASGLARWLYRRRNIRQGSCFIDLCYIAESESIAWSIKSALREDNIEHEWDETQ